MKIKDLSLASLASMPLALFIVAPLLMGQDAGNGCGEPPPDPPADGWPLVYSRHDRDQTIREYGGTADNWQHVADVGRVNGQIAESDLVIDYRNGTIDIIEDCTKDKQRLCVAHEAAVSPDGRKIAYSLGFGQTEWPVKVMNGPWTDLVDVNMTVAEIWVYDIETKAKTRLTTGSIDRGPTWASNNVLMFTSDRDKLYPNLGYIEYPYYTIAATRLYRMNADGTGVVNLTPHEQLVMDPTVMSNGEACFTAWNGFGIRGTGYSPRNMWWTMCVDSNGFGPMSGELAAHGSAVIDTRRHIDPVNVQSGEGGTTFRALRPVSEIAPGKRCAGNYYRSNSTGALGMILCWEDNGEAEGARVANDVPAYLYRSQDDYSGRYVPSTLYQATSYGQDQDLNDPRFKVLPDGSRKPAGRAGWAAPHPDYEFMFTHARGHCYEHAFMEKTVVGGAYLNGEPSCKKEIRGAKVANVTDPFDPAQSEVIACGELEYQCWDAHVIAPYEVMFGMETPPIAEPHVPVGSVGILQVVDFTQAESGKIPGLANNEKVDCQFQGCFRDGKPPTLNDIFQIKQVELWNTRPEQGRSGYRREWPIVWALPETDGSIKIEVPCEKPFLMSALEGGTGEVIADDMMPHSVRCGEVRTCFGCHDGHSEKRFEELGGDAVAAFNQTIAAGKPPQNSNQPAPPEAASQWDGVSVD
jgi:hypothetical protein